MGIRFQCPNGHKLNVKNDLAGKRASCPECGAKLTIPDASVEPARVHAVVPDVRVGEWYVRLTTGEELGLATDALLGDWIRAGRVTADTRLRRADWADWKLARDAVDELPIPLAAIPIATAERPAAIGIPAPLPPPELPQAAAPESVASESTIIPMPAVGSNDYLQQRQRTKKMQLTLAVIMLVAALVLAGVLAWIVLSNSAAANHAVRSSSVARSDTELASHIFHRDGLHEPSEAK